jgi:hypothetical protein
VDFLFSERELFMNIAGQHSIAASNTTECEFQLKAPGACELVVDEGISCFRIIVCIQDGFLSMKKTRTKRSSVLGETDG